MGPKILIADDEVHIRILLEQTLEDLVDLFDITLLFASDGDEALTLIRQEIPRLVFLDIMMPQRDGYEVCQAINQDPELKDIPKLKKERFFPFCSQKCKMSDLYGWFSEEYKISRDLSPGDLIEKDEEN